MARTLIPFMVAEMGASHLGDLDVARRTVEAAAEAGAHGIKFQTYHPDSIAADRKIEEGPWAGRSYRDLYTEGMLPWGWQPKLFSLARELGLVPFSAPFSEEAVDFLEQECDCPIYKIASPEIIHYPLIAKAARTGKPLIISTGMATPREIQTALITAYENGAQDVTLLHCISAYPAGMEDMNLSSITQLENYNCKVGLSDHSMSSVPAVIATILGADVIEKHFTLSRSLGGPDAAFSAEPHEFTNMVNACVHAAQAYGFPQFGEREAEASSRAYRRSLWAANTIEPGQQITADDVEILRPALGLHPKYRANIIGATANTRIMAGRPITWDMINEKT